MLVSGIIQEINLIHHLCFLYNYDGYLSYSSCSHRDLNRGEWKCQGVRGGDVGGVFFQTGACAESIRVQRLSQSDERLQRADHCGCWGDGNSLGSFLSLSCGFRYCLRFSANCWHLDLGLIQGCQGTFQRRRTGLAFSNISDGLILKLFTGYKDGLTQLQFLFNFFFFALSWK